MLLQAARDLNIDLSNSWMIGDSLSDIEAGRRAGCNAILLNKDFNLLDAVEDILANDNH